MPPRAMANDPLPAKSYMFTQAIKPTQVNPGAFTLQPKPEVESELEAESGVPSNPPSLYAGLSETVPQHLQRQQSTFGLDSILKPMEHR